MKKLLVGLFVFALLAMGSQAHASTLSDALLKIKNLTNEIAQIKSSLMASVGTASIDGICAPTHYSCTIGTSDTNVEGSNSYNWNCTGLNGGAGAVCTEARVMSGTLTPATSSCKIASGASTCSLTLNWSTTNPLGVSVVTTPGINDLRGYGNSGSQAFALGNSTRTFNLINNGVTLASATTTGSCMDGTTWDTASQTCKGTTVCTNGATNPPTCSNLIASVTVTAPSTGNVVLGSTSNISWTSSNIPTTNSMRIELYKNGVYQNLLAFNQPVRGTYQWTPVAGGAIVAGSGYKVRVVKEYDNTNSVFDDSDGTFTISSAVPPECNGPSTLVCSITNGSGLQSRSCNNGTWGDYGSCNVQSCNTGYKISGNGCVASPVNTATLSVSLNSASPQSGILTVSNTNIISGFQMLKFNVKNTAGSRISFNEIKVSLKGQLNVFEKLYLVSNSNGNISSIKDFYNNNNGVYTFSLSDGYVIGSGVTETFSVYADINGIGMNFDSGSYISASFNDINGKDINGDPVYEIGSANGSNQYLIQQTNTTPSITVLSPNGGEVYQAGQQITVKWNSNNIPASSKNIDVILHGYNSNGVIVWSKELSTFILNDGQEEAILPTYLGDVSFGKNFVISVGTDSTNNPSSIYDISDTTFTIKTSITEDGCIGGTIFSSTTGGPCYGVPTTDTTPRVSFWPGKVNQHVAIGSRTDMYSASWQTDSDGVTGSGVDKLTYCKKFYPNTTSVQEYKTETFAGWRDRGNLSNYTGTNMSYQCVQGIVNTTTAVGYIYADDIKGELMIGNNQYINLRDTSNMTSNITSLKILSNDIKNSLINEYNRINGIGWINVKVMGTLSSITLPGTSINVKVIEVNTLNILNGSTCTNGATNYPDCTITQTLPAGCTTTSGYSPITGVRCDGSQGNPDGCQPGNIFSPITGQKCTDQIHVCSNGSNNPPLCTFGLGSSDPSGCLNGASNPPLCTINVSNHITRTLKKGIKGDDVKILQLFLNLAADGSFGPATQQKVIEWQKAHGLNPDGAFGIQSATAAGLAN